MKYFFKLSKIQYSYFLLQCLNSLFPQLKDTRSLYPVFEELHNISEIVCFAQDFSANRGKSHLVQHWKTAPAQTYLIFIYWHTWNTLCRLYQNQYGQQLAEDELKQLYFLIIQIWQQNFLLCSCSELCYFSSSALVFIVCCFTHAGYIQYCFLQFFNF